MSAIEHSQVFIFERLNPDTYPVEEVQLTQLLRICNRQIFRIGLNGHLLQLARIVILSDCLYHLKQLCYRQNRWRSASKINSSKRMVLFSSPQMQFLTQRLHIPLLIPLRHRRVESAVGTPPMAIWYVEIKNT